MRETWGWRSVVQVARCSWVGLEGLSEGGGKGRGTYESCVSEALDYFVR